MRITWAFDAVAIVCILAMSAVLYNRARYYPEVAYDESAAILGLGLLHGDFGNRIDPGGISYTRYYSMDCYPPVYYLANAAVFAVRGFGLLQARLASIVFVALTALLCYVAGRRYSGPGAGLLAMTAYFWIPHRVYIIVNRPDVAVPFFLLASVIVSIEASRRQRFLLHAASGALYSLAVLSHYGGLMAAPFIALLPFVLTRGSMRHRLTAFSAFVVGASVPVLLYLWYSSPYTDAIWRSFINYAGVGVAAAPGGLAGRWPLRPTLEHFLVLWNYYPVLLTAVLPVATAAGLLGWLSSTWRSRITPAGLVFIAAFLSLFVLVGTYPNIATYGYYAPFYLVFGAVATGMIAAAVLPRQGRFWLLSPMTGIVAAAFMINAMAAKADAEIASVSRIPLRAVDEWSARQPDLSLPTLAMGQWVFSAARDRIMSRRLVTMYEGGPELNRDFVKVVPDAPRLPAYRTIISDGYDEYSTLHELLARDALIRSMPGDTSAAYPQMRASYVLQTTEFETVAMIRDRQRLSSNATILRRLADRSHPAPWPRIARTTPDGPEEQTIDSGCVTSIPLNQPLARVIRTPPVWAHQVPLELGKALSNRLLVARVVLHAADGQPLPPGFVAYYTTRAEERAAMAMLEAGEAPLVDPELALGVTGFRLSTGERGRDLLIGGGRYDVSPATGPLAVYSFGPAVLDRVDLALGLTNVACDATQRAVLADIGNRVIHPRPTVLSSSASVSLGDPVIVKFSRPATVEFVVFLDGAVATRSRVENASEAQLMLTKPGSYGIEVWITDPDDGTRSLRQIYPVVRP